MKNKEEKEKKENMNMFIKILALIELGFCFYSAWWTKDPCDTVLFGVLYLGLLILSREEK